MFFFILSWSPTSYADDSAGEGSSEGSELPLTASQTLSFSLDEVTWLSLDISPDDQTIILEVLGDIYKLPIGGGTAIPLFERMAFDSQPAWSPDGRYVAFISDQSGNEELWLYDLIEQKEEQLSDSKSRILFASPAWSPDGKRVLVSKRTMEMATFELWSYSVNGGSGVQITFAKSKSDVPRSQQHNALGGVFGLNQRYLYYARKSGGPGYNLKFPMWQIARRDLARGQEDILTNAPGSAFRPIVSPDGEWLVYGTRHQQQTGLRIRHLESGKDRWLAFPVQRDEQEARYTRDLLPGYAFTSDSKRVITSRGGKIISVDIASRDVEEIPLRVDVQKKVAVSKAPSSRVGLGPVRSRILGHPDISPDGKHAAFHAFGRIYTYEFATAEAVAISPRGLNAAMPTWSPDGREIAYVSWQDGVGAIVKQRARVGAKRTGLTSAGGYYTDPVWSPDGKRIFALRGSGIEFERREVTWNQVTGADLIWVSTRGRGTQERQEHFVLPTRGLTSPHFGPETERIYLYIGASPNPRKAAHGLVSVKFDGTDRKEHLLATAPGIYYAGDLGNPQRMRMSPSGKHILIKHAHQLYVVEPIPELKQQKINLAKPNLPLAKLTDIGADYMGWDESGSVVYWSSGSELHRRAIESINFSEEVADGPEAAIDGSLLEDNAAVATFDISIYEPRSEPQSPIALVGGTVIRPTGEILADATVLSEKGRISFVGAAQDLQLTADTKTIDVTGTYLLPGFIDTHAHYGAMAELNEPSPWPLLANLAYGVTTGLDVQPSTVSVLALKDNIDAGFVAGPRAFSTGPGVFSDNEFESYQQAVAVLRRYKEKYRVSTVKAYLSGSRKQRQWLIKAANDLQLRVTSEGGADLKTNLTMMIDGFHGQEHALPQPRLYDDVVQLAGRVRLGYTPTLLVSYGGPFGENWFYTHASPYDDDKVRRFMPYDFLAKRALRRAWFHGSEYVTDEIARSAVAIKRAGGELGVGAHGQLQGLGYHWELWALARGGLSNAEALYQATLGGAELIGAAADLGSLEVGKLADVLVLENNPLDDLRNTLTLRYVIKGGVLYDANTLDRLWPEPEPLAKQWWQKGGIEELP
ncbi:MAG: amidohydrolase family protein [Pseudomonadales bacterium]|nr:amidohydrolase family protein [Pseudomonadales bacterium]